MMILTVELPTTASKEAVFAYLSDFTTTTEWDPGTVETTLASGNGGLGTVYNNRSRFGGRESALTYTVTRFDAPNSITLWGENDAVNAIDTISVEERDGHNVVTYQADFTFKGVARLASPFFGPAFRKLRNEAEEGLRLALKKLEVQ